MNTKKNTDLSFKKEAVYRIVVDGFIDKNQSEILGGMQITTANNKDASTISSLVGEIKDQAALSGVLNNLYDMQFTVISVNMLFNK